MKEIKCPNEYSESLYEQGLFLGGGITSAPLWQPIMVELLKDTNLILVNPRRDSFDITDPSMTIFQIEWEHKYLSRVGARMFWFPCETLCPITLLELGKFMETATPLFVGCHPEYQRKLDVEIQLKLARPWNCEVSDSLEGLAERIKQWSKTPISSTPRQRAATGHLI